MKKLIYLVLSVLCAIIGITGIYDTITTPQDDLAISIMTILLLAFLAWLFMHLFLKSEPRHKHQAENAPEPSQEAPIGPTPTQTEKTADTERGGVAEADYDDYVAIDIETTGLGRSARIIELGAVRMRHGRKVASFSQLVNPQIPIPAKVTQITGITDRDVKGKPTIDKALPKFYAFCGQDTWIGHNIRRFDLPVIAREAERAGVGMPDVSFYDTLEISQTLLPQLDRHRLIDLIRYFGIAKTERHRAADDAAQTAQVFERLKQI